MHMSARETIPTVCVSRHTFLDHLAEYRPYLFAFLYKRHSGHLNDPEAADDLVQETFLKAVQRFDSFRGSTASEFRSWLRSVLHHTVVDALRRQQSAGAGSKVVQDEVLTPVGGSPLDELVAAEEETHL